MTTDTNTSQERTIEQEVQDTQELRKLLDRVIGNTGAVVHDDGPNANLFDTARFNQCYRVARAMAGMSILPEHLRMVGTKNNKKQLSKEQVIANCFRVVNQAVRWGFDPYAIVDETYVANGKLGYQGKLVAAVVNARAGLRGRLTYEHSGEGEDRQVTVTGSFRDDPDPKQITLRVRDARTDNTMWSTDPDQKLCYSGAIKWARRYCPEVVLGVMTDDDLDRIAAEDPTPEPETVGSLDELTEWMKRKQEPESEPKSTTIDNSDDPEAARSGALFDTTPNAAEE